MHIYYARISSITTTLATLAILTAGSSAIADPIIDGISTVSTAGGQFIEISGSGFTEGPNVILFDDFETGKLGNYVLPESARIGSWNAVPETSAKPYYVQESPNNLGFLARDLSMPQGSQRPILKLAFGDSYQEVFLSYSVKVPEDRFFSGAAEDRACPDSSSWKFVWLMSSEGLRSNDGLLDLAIPSHVGGGSFLIGGNDGNVTWIASGDSWWSWHNFNNMAFHIKIDELNPTATPVNWSFETVSTKHVGIASGKADSAAFSSTDYQFDKLHVPGWWGNGDTTNFQAIYDNVYVAVGKNAQSRIIATDNESFTESTMSMTLPPQSWSDSRILIDFDLIPSWDQVFLHAVDTNGNRTTTGKALCPKCPVAIDAQVK